MSTQRVCDLDRQIIDPAKDHFFTIKDGRTGQERDICAYCARSRLAATNWQPSTALSEIGMIVKPTTGIDKYVFMLVESGTSGVTEPVWPNTNNKEGTLIDDGTLQWKTYPRPRDAAIVDVNMPGTTKFRTSVWGWMTGTNEPVA